MGKRPVVEDRPLSEQIKESFERRFREMLDEEYEAFISCITTPQRKSFRINTIKSSSPDSVTAGLQEKGLRFSPVSWCDNGYYLHYEEGNRSDLGNSYEHFLGKIYVQEATSMLPPLLLDIPSEVPDDFRVLDMAAAPGSKTTQLGELMQNRGLLVANEVDYARLGALKGNLERSGLMNTVITHQDGRNLNTESYFDRILLDAPCSGSGVIRKSPKTIRLYNPKKLKGVQRLQLQLLRKAYELLKPGGILVYSTCSLDPEEDELCIQKFLDEGHGCELVSSELPGLELNRKPVTSFEGKDIPETIHSKVIRIWPHHHDTNGFFVAKLRKH